MRLPPDVFWRLSLPEWRALTRPPPARAPLARQEFEDLLTSYPD